MASVEHQSNLRSISHDVGTSLGIWSNERYRRAILSSAGMASRSTDAHVLWVLAFNGSCRPSQIANRIGSGAPAVTKAVNRLHQGGYVSVEADEDDRRAARVSITAKGREVAKKIAKARDRIVAEVMADWSPEDVAQFAKYSRRFTDGLVDHEEHATRGAH